MSRNLPDLLSPTLTLEIGTVTATTFSWIKKVIKPVKIQGGGGMSLKNHIAKGKVTGGIK